MKVWVCESDNCHLCGSFAATSNGHWARVGCGNDRGIGGSSVKLGANENYLQVAEIEVYGFSK